MAPPRKAAARGRTRRRVRKNIAIGQAHIKTSFNNTIVSLTDKEGNVIVWESAGSAGFKGSRKSTPFAAQVTADNAARKGMEHGLQKVEVFVKGPGSGRETAIRSLQAAGLEILGVKDVSPQAHNGVRPEEAEARLVARDLGPKCRQCRREGIKLFLKGERCLTEKCAIERRSYPPGEHGRGRIKQSEYLLQLREKQKARRYYGLLEKQFRNTYEKASSRHRPDGREPPADARDAARQRRLPARLRRLARPGAPARPPRPLPRQRPPGQHPELRRAARRHRSPSSRAAPRRRSSATRPI